jgi:hypothetical protein
LVLQIHFKHLGVITNELMKRFLQRTGAIVQEDHALEHVAKDRGLAIVPDGDIVSLDLKNESREGLNDVRYEICGFAYRGRMNVHFIVIHGESRILSPPVLAHEKEHDMLAFDHIVPPVS